MSTRTRRLACPPEAVWAVLADGWSYPAFVVGCVRMRAVDPAWPAAGAQLHHGVGAWPFVLQDTTTCRAASAPHHLALLARGWPAGQAEVDLEVEADGAGSRVRMSEQPAGGAGTGLARPLVAALVWLRNGEALRRLAEQAEGRAGCEPPHRVGRARPGRTGP